MRAVQVVGPGQVAIRELSRPAPAPGEVLVEVVAAAICGTDRKLTVRGGEQPRTLGHEVTGRAGGAVVGLHPEVGCGECAACRAGWQNRCPRRRALGLDRDGGLAEAVAVPAAQLVPLPGLDPIASTMLEPLACAVHAVETAQVPPGAPAVVVGAGAMGILCAWALQAAGSRVVVCQRSPQRRRLAAELGADAAIGPEDDPARWLGEPPAAVLVTAAGGEPLQWALAQVATGGVVHAFAGSVGGAPVDANTIHYRHLRLVGSTGSRLRDYQRARELVTGGQVKLDRLPHRRIGLDQAPAAVLEDPPVGVLKRPHPLRPGHLPFPLRRKRIGRRWARRVGRVLPSPGPATRQPQLPTPRSARSAPRHGPPAPHTTAPGGHHKHEAAGRDGGNSRNGTRAKTVLTEIGPVEIEVPRDRDGSIASDASLLRRLTEAHQRNRQLAEENQRLRRQLAHALGDQRTAQRELHNGPDDHPSVTILPGATGPSRHAEPRQPHRPQHRPPGHSHDPTQSSR